MIDLSFCNIIASRLSIQVHRVKTVLELIEESCTIPFIARYRKEKTGGLDEIQIKDISKLYHDLEELAARKKFILETILEQGQLTDLLRKQIEQAEDALVLEDLYAPYKKKKKSKADIAIENGLLPLAELILNNNSIEFNGIASKYFCDLYPDILSVRQGTIEIIASRIADDSLIRESIREQLFKKSSIQSRIIKSKEAEKIAATYRDYFDYNESIKSIPSHRYLAIERGEKQKLLRVKLIHDESDIFRIIARKYYREQSRSRKILEDAIVHSWTSSLNDIIDIQIHNILKKNSDEVATKVFAENIRQLFLEAPLGEKTIIAIDPGFRTGSKVVVLDQYGDLQKYYTIFPLQDIHKSEEALNKLNADIKRYSLHHIAVGDGTAGRETVEWIKSNILINELFVFNISEQGASIYSASEIAREEFADLDITYRGAISIGRRLLDPMAELIKIDPKSIGIGQYQHDVNQKLLKESLDFTLLSCVNKVGVNVNTASKYLLTYISGLGPTISENIVQYRKEIGKINSKNELKKVPRLGPKAFEQCAGFLRIKDGINPLDNTSIHPEHYSIVDKMAKNLGVSLAEFIANENLRKKIVIKDFVSNDVGEPTIIDIFKELDKPGLDPRGEFSNIEVKIRNISELKDGMILDGIVNNITKFGAFVDIGLKVSGLIHISEMSEKFISDPNEIVHLKQKVKVKIISIEESRDRIQLSLKF